MKGSSLSADRPVVRPLKMLNSSVVGTTAVTIISIKAMEITAPVFWSIVRVPDAMPRRCGGTAPIIAAVFGELKTPDPTPTSVSQTADCQKGVSTWRVVIPASPPAVSSIPSTAGAREPWRSAHQPAIGEDTSIPAASGISLMPAVIGSSPWGPWK